MTGATPPASPVRRIAELNEQIPQLEAESQQLEKAAARPLSKLPNWPVAHDAYSSCAGFARSGQSWKSGRCWC